MEIIAAILGGIGVWIILKILIFIIIGCLIIWFIFKLLGSVDDNEKSSQAKHDIADEAEDFGGKVLDVFGKIFFYIVIAIIILVVVLVFNIF